MSIYNHMIAKDVSFIPVVIFGCVKLPETSLLTRLCIQAYACSPIGRYELLIDKRSRFIPEAVMMTLEKQAIEKSGYRFPGRRFNRTNGLAIIALAATLWMLFASRQIYGQVDQGAITGTVQDSTGAVVSGATVTLTDTDTGLVLQAKTDRSGIYTFSPLKIGDYKISTTAPGFQTTTQENLRVQVQERLNVQLTLQPGAVTKTVTVSSAPPLLQSQSGAVGVTMSTRTINTTPLAQRNWVYMAQLSAGVVPSTGTRGGGTGDFEANGVPAEQNNFILDGVDNNVNIVDFMNGATYAVAPPPDALSEFQLQTADFSAQFGHSAGAVLQATVKSGTNHIHGNVWEYFRNTNMDAKNWNATINPPYHMNQFGATLGFPILKNKLFYFGDVQATRIAFSNPDTVTVPTPLMRKGNFSELLNPSLTGNSEATYLYQPNSNMGSYGGGPDLLMCNGAQNVFCPNKIDQKTLKILNLYPLPNANGGKTYNNLVENLKTNNNVFQWDQRVDWNISTKDQTYARYSYANTQNALTPPLGPILDGTGNYAGTQESYLSENFMLSETHEFSPTLINELRFAYNYGHYQNLQANHNIDVASQLGLGGMPFGPGYPNNGGLPQVSLNNAITTFGSHGNDPSVEGQNIYQILDNVTKILDNHTLKFGVALQNIRVSFLQPPASRGTYGYTGEYTGVTGVSNTGFGVADFLANQMNNAGITNMTTFHQEQRYDSAYAEDNWRVTPKITANFGVRYDFFQPYRDLGGLMANWVPLTESIGTGTGEYLIPTQSRNVPLSPVFLGLLNQDHVSLVYDSNQRLSNSQKTNFAPRLGIAYQIDPRTVVRAGYGIFYGGLQSVGAAPNLGVNYPFELHALLSAVSCTAGTTCPSLTNAATNYVGAPDVTLENGLSNQISAGILNFITQPVVNGRDTSIHTPYTMSWNLAIQHAFTNDTSATLAYVGNAGRHLETELGSNPPLAMEAPGINTQSVTPFPQFSDSEILNYSAMSNYNSLQATLQKRYSNGFNYLASYTWGHALTNDTDPLGGGVSYRNDALVPIGYEYSNSNYDVRQRISVNLLYDLPFGIGRAHMNHSRVADAIAGGWSASLTFEAQTGTPFTVSTSNISTPSGVSAWAIKVADPFKAGGSPPPSNPSITCPAHVRNPTNWYNPCAFANPPNAAVIPSKGPGSQITDLGQILRFTGGRTNVVAGPGFQRVNMSLFKNFLTWGGQYLQLRGDAFNLTNTPAFSTPSTTNNNNTGGLITGVVSFQANTPDARFFQVAAKYYF